jgi:hypothetical protein
MVYPSKSSSIQSVFTHKMCGGGEINMAKGSGPVNALIGFVITAVVVIIMYTKVILNESLFNTSATAPEYSITSVVVPMIGVAITVGLIIGAVYLIVHFVKGSSTSR